MTDLRAPRRKSVAVDVGGVVVGGDAPVVVQSMTNTDTADVDATVRQIADLARAGSELVRITVNNEAAAAAVANLRKLRRGSSWQPGREKGSMSASLSDCASLSKA